MSAGGAGSPGHGGAAVVEIGGRWVGAGEPVLVIAEIGINHNGSLEMARKR